MPNTLITQAADYIQQADSLIIAAGAGMGVDSGLPDFRGFLEGLPCACKSENGFYASGIARYLCARCETSLGVLWAPARALSQHYSPRRLCDFKTLGRKQSERLFGIYQ